MVWRKPGIREKAASAKQRISNMLRPTVVVEVGAEDFSPASGAIVTSQLSTSPLTDYSPELELMRAELKRAEAIEHWRRWDRLK